jgi:hypothetical protein
MPQRLRLKVLNNTQCMEFIQRGRKCHWLTLYKVVHGAMERNHNKVFPPMGTVWVTWYTIMSWMAPDIHIVTWKWHVMYANRYMKI